MKNYKKLLFLISYVSIFSLAACTSAQTRRGITGAAIGGAAGLGISAISGGDLATGALVGGAAGGAIGAATAPDDREYRRHYHHQY